MRGIVKHCLFLFTIAAGAPAFAWQATQPYTFERFALPGPLAGTLVRLDLRNPHVQVEVALADPRAPDGDGPAVGMLDTPSHAARTHDYAVTLNASFFKAPVTREINGKKIAYFVGNGGTPAGWHFSEGRLVSQPDGAALRATMVVHEGGNITLEDGLASLPPDTRYAVSGNAMMLREGAVTPPALDLLRHPRTAVGLSADGNTLLLLALDGRQEGHSRGATLAELGTLMAGFGAWQAINLDGGGSTVMVLKDRATGVFSIVNRPSDQSAQAPGFSIERPVIDVLGVRVTP